MQADKTKQLEYNLSVLKRRDAAITRLLDMAGHVVLYQFNEETKAWDRKGVEGSLFVVERSTAPKHQFVVLNRLSSENLVETIDADFQTELTDQFLLYRNASSEILGVWFYSPPERAAISELLGTLTGGGDAAAAPAEGADEAPPADVGDGAAPANVAQLFNMMAVAQQDAPPMPETAMTSSQQEASAVASTAPAPSQPPAPPAAAPAPPARPPVDMAKLKTKLAGQLRALVDDDAFLTLLATEYLRQQQRAMAQAQQARQQRKSLEPSS
jgi:mRNA-decapping enzyme 1B